jgi:hypothetical protein
MGATFLGLSLVTLLLLLTGCDKPQPAPDEISYSSLREKVVQRVKAREIGGDATGVAVLPQDLAAASVNGQVWIAQDARTGWRIAFPLSMAKMEFLLYAEKPVPADGKTIQVGPAAVAVWRRVEEHWYQARVETPASPR